MDQVKFAVKIKEARKAKGMTQKELAAHLQVTDKAVSKWERALSFPDIELLGPISKELDIPLTELLDMEELTQDDEQRETVETLLHKMMPLMKERVQQEIKRKKKWLYIGIAVLLSVSFAVVIYPEIREGYRLAEYDASKQVISYEELTVDWIEQKEDGVFIEISKPEDIDVYGSYWRDKENPEIAYFNYYYYEKPWLIYSSMEEYLKATEHGYTEMKPEQFDMPVTKIIYYDTQEHVLWEK